MAAIPALHANVVTRLATLRTEAATAHATYWNVLRLIAAGTDVADATIRAALTGAAKTIADLDLDLVVAQRGVTARI